MSGVEIAFWTLFLPVGLGCAAAAAIEAGAWARRALRSRAARRRQVAAVPRGAAR